MSALTRDQATAHIRKVVKDSFDKASANVPDPQTPEEMATLHADREKVRQDLIDAITIIAVDCYDALPAPSTPSSSPRTAAIEHVIHEMTLKLVEHPSTPYSSEAAETLGKMLEALDRSLVMDERLDDANKSKHDTRYVQRDWSQEDWARGLEIHREAMRRGREIGRADEEMAFILAVKAMEAGPKR